MNTSKLSGLADEWLTEASVFTRRGQAELAEMARSYANELKERLREWWLEELTPSQAAEELGLTTSALSKRVETGTLMNVGSKGSPRYRRCDVHARGRAATPMLLTDDGLPDVAGEVLRAAGCG